MFKIFILINIIFNIVVSALEIKAISITDDKNSYDVYDGDILFTNQDKLQFTFFSKVNTKLEINYIHENSKNNIKNIELTKDETVTFPKEGLLNFDKDGDVVFQFKDNKTTQTFHLKYIKNSSSKLLKTKNDIKYALDPNKIIVNSRGLKEKEAYNHLVKSTVIVESPNEIGSGVVISKDGRILTNYHVIHNQENINIAFKPKSKYATNPHRNSFLKVKILKVDPLKDLALLQILDSDLAQNLTPINLTTLEDIDIGEDVFTMGHPQKEYFTLGWGTVSSVRQNYSWNNHKANFVIQTQSAISKGNSGGPLIGEDYKLIGLNSFSNIQGQNLNFAVSIDDINEFLSKKINKTFKIKLDNQYKDYVKLSSRDGFDTKNNPFIEYTLDGNNNNIKDLLAIDVGNNGVYNYLLFDEDEDGSFEKKAYDKDGDGVIERVVRY